MRVHGILRMYLVFNNQKNFGTNHIDAWEIVFSLVVYSVS